jgi:hypothetical protein
MRKHCRICGERGTERWDIRVCADGRRPRSFMLCDGCDVAVNGLILLFLGDKTAMKKLRRYALRARKQK